MWRRKILTTLVVVSIVFLCNHRAMGYGLWAGNSFIASSDLSGSQGKITSGDLEYTIESSLDVTFGGVTGPQWNTAITTALNTWDTELPFTFALDTALTSNEITFKALALQEGGQPDTGTWATTSTSNVITFNTNMTWTTNLAQAVTLHEIGHSLGLDDMYDKSTLPGSTHYFGADIANGPYGHNAIPGALATHGNTDNGIPVMYGYLNSATAPGKFALTADDIAGSRWLYGSYEGSSLACIDVTGDVSVADDKHHGDNNSGKWTYGATVALWGESGPGYAGIELKAGTGDGGVRSASIYNGVTGALIYSETSAAPITQLGWDILFGDDFTRITTSLNFDGDLRIELNSLYTQEKIIDWGINANVISSGQTFGPVPEPGTLSLLGICAMTLLRRKRK